MRVLLFISVVMCSGAMLIGGCQTTPQAGASQAAASETAPIETATATLTVHGMGCPLCANNVDKQLLAVHGVERVNINLGSGEVKVHLADVNRPSRAQLARAVDQSGFTLVRIETP